MTSPSPHILHHIITPAHHLVSKVKLIIVVIKSLVIFSSFFFRLCFLPFNTCLFVTTWTTFHWHWYIHCELLPGTLLKSLLELYQGFFGLLSLKPLENGKESEPFWPVFHLVPFHWQGWKSGLPRFQLVTGFLEDLVAQMPFSVSEWSLCSSQRSQLSAECGWISARL